MKLTKLTSAIFALAVFLSFLGCGMLQQQKTQETVKDVLTFTEVLCVLGHAEKSEPKLIASACKIRDALVPAIEKTLLEHKLAGQREAALRASASASASSSAKPPAPLPASSSR